MGIACFAPLAARSDRRMGHERKNLRIGWTVAAIAIVALPVLYVLGVGPMTRLWNRDYISREFMVSVYGPLMWVAIQDNWVGECFGAYIKLWR